MAPAPALRRGRVRRRRCAGTQSALLWAVQSADPATTPLRRRAPGRRATQEFAGVVAGLSLIPSAAPAARRNQDWRTMSLTSTTKTYKDIVAEFKLKVE